MTTFFFLKITIMNIVTRIIRFTRSVKLFITISLRYYLRLIGPTISNYISCLKQVDWSNYISKTIFVPSSGREVPPGQPILCKAKALNKNKTQFEKGCSTYMEELKKLLNSTSKRVVANFLGWRWLYLHLEYTFVVKNVTVFDMTSSKRVDGTYHCHHNFSSFSFTHNLSSVRFGPNWS